MTQKFEREERFIVIKRKHLSAIQENEIRCYLHAQSIPTIESVVVESDWAIYEETWENVQRMAEGKSSIKQDISDMAMAADGLSADVTDFGQQIDELKDQLSASEEHIRGFPSYKAINDRDRRIQTETLDELIDSLTEVGGEITINAIQDYRDALARGE